MVMSSTTTTTPYLERLKAGLRQARPKQVDDLWISSTHLSSSRRVVMAAEQREVDKSMAHLFAENLDWWCRDDEMLDLLRDKTRLQRLVNVTVESAIWISQHHSQAAKSQGSSFSTSSCVGCSLPFESNSSSSSQGSSNNSTSGDDGRRAVPVSMDAEEMEHRLHLLTISMAVICGLLRHAPADSSDLTDRLVVMLSIDTPNIMPLLEEEGGSSEQQASSILLPWVEEQMREGRPQATPPLVELLGNSCSTKAAVGAAGLLSLVLCHRPAVVLNSLQEDVTLTSLNRYLQNVCFPVLVQQRPSKNSTSSSTSPCLVQERFGLVAFLNILPTLYYLGSWKMARRRNQMMESLVARLVTIILNLCHSATLDTITAKPNATTDGNSGTLSAAAAAATSYRTNDGPADLEHLPELINAKFVVLESLLMMQTPPLPSSPQNPSAMTTAAPNNNNWRMGALQQRPMTCAVAAGLEVLAWWSRHGIDLFDIHLDDVDVDELDMASLIPKEESAATTNARGSGGLKSDDKDSSRTPTTTTIADCFTEYLPRIQILAQRVPARLGGCMETIARALAQGVKPPSSAAAMAAAVEVSSTTETATPTSGVTSLFLEEPFSLARDRCGLPSCRRRRAAVVMAEQQQHDPDAIVSKTSGSSTGSSSSKHLKVCNGGCKGLERYCSRDHQKEHWPIHKMFCKNNKSSAPPSR